MGRIPYGIECVEEKYDYIRSIISHRKNIMLSDSLEIREDMFPLCDFSMSSPPYYPVDPTSSIGKDGDYATYLRDIADIYRRLGRCMRKDAYIIIEVSNLRDDIFVPLAWDIAREVSKYLTFVQEVVVGWED